MGKELEGGDQESGLCTAIGQMWSESRPYCTSGEASRMGKTLGCGLRLWGLAYQGAPVVSRVLTHHGKGNHPCPLCDIAPLEDSVMGHLLVNHCRELGLVQETDLELILCQLVELDINFLVKFRNLYSFPVR